MAIIIVTPFLYMVAVGVEYIAAYLVNVPKFHSVSEGGYWRVFWAFVEPTRLVGGLIQTYVIGVLIVFASTYYGYNARGGAVGVGRNTAKSMIVSLIITGLFGVVGQLLFFTGLEGPAIGN
jgi:phospholipid/cholesterol/gamma-HCH transport system permease protein